MILLSPVLLLLLALSGCFTEVVDDFKNTCPQFFVKKSPPTVFHGKRYKQICQIRENEYKYATFYDTKYKIPVYSAYKFEGLMNCEKKIGWFIEPQLEDRNGSKEMANENSLVQYNHQAVNADYSRSGFNAGHLATIYQAESKSCDNATFTLTNAAPQYPWFHKHIWSNVEIKVANILEKCPGTFKHIVTGVLPDRSSVNKRVKVSKFFWTAYCCLNNSYHVIEAGGFLKWNTNFPVKTVQIVELDEILSALYNHGHFSVFGGYCDTSTTTLRLIQSRGLSRILCLDNEIFPTMFEKRRCMSLLRQEKKGC